MSYTTEHVDFFEEDEPSPETTCRKPCDPDTGCPHCAEYWERMSREGLWDMKKHQWTNLGWNDILKRV